MLQVTRLATLLLNIIAIFSIGSFLFIVSSENMFQTFTPRRLCMFQDEKLVMTHLVSDALTFIAYTVISACLYGIYRAFQTKDVPFKGFFWMYAGFIFLCGLTHLMGVINLYVTYYWFDGIIKLLTGYFSIAVAISFLRAKKSIKEFKTPAEYQALAKELEELRARLGMKE